MRMIAQRKMALILSILKVSYTSREFNFIFESIFGCSKYSYLIPIKFKIFQRDSNLNLFELPIYSTTLSILRMNLTGGVATLLPKASLNRLGNWPRTMKVRRVFEYTIHTLSKFHCLLHELYLTNHHSSQEHAICGTFCLLLAFLNPTTCHLSNLRSINLI